MDLLHIARKLWRYKLVTVPIIMMMVAASAYVLIVKQPLYEASSSYLLINPPAPPTPDEVARNPALGKIRADNPYTRFADQAVVIDVLTRTMNGAAAREGVATTRRLTEPNTPRIRQGVTTAYGTAGEPQPSCGAVHA